MNDIIKIVKSLKGAGFLMKGISKIVNIEAKKKKKGWVLSMLARTLGTSLLGNMLAGKVVIRAGEGAVTAG